MKSYRALLPLACGAVLLAALAAPAAPPDGYRLAWSDEFDGTALDTNKWEHRHPGKRRDAINSAEAVSVGGGQLTIATWTAGGKHHTGMIATHGRFERTVGYWEARIRFDDSPGEWSAFWIHSDRMGRPVGDPASAGMELDVVEHRVRDKGGKDISDTIQHNVHWDGYGRDHKSKGFTTPALGLGRGFHTYGLEWTEKEYRFYVDDKLTWTAPTPVSRHPQFILLSSEIEDKGWAGNIPDGGYGSRESSKTRMVVDYVRYYEHK